MQIQNFKEYFLKTRNYIFGFAEDINIYSEEIICAWNKNKSFLNPVIEYKNEKTICYCTGVKKITNGDKCELCNKRNNSFKNKYIMTKDKVKFSENWIKENNFSNNTELKEYKPIESLILDNFLFVWKNSENESGINISKIIAKTTKFKENNPELIDIEFKEEKRLEIIPNKKYNAYKISNNKKQNIDITEILPISTSLINKDIDILFYNSESMIDFLFNNKLFAERTALLKFLRTINTEMTQNSFFIFYLYLYSQYPVVEFLIKMGHYSLIENLIKDTLNKHNKEEIILEINMLSKLFNNTTKGSLALTIPQYISDFLKEKNADYKEYMMWTDIFELEFISKENFEKYISSRQYIELNFNNHLPNLISSLKYGYTIDKVTKYILKQFYILQKQNLNKKEIINYFFDYLHMCDLMQINIDLYPQNIKEAHDNIVKIFKAQQDKEKDKIMENISKKYTKIIPPQFENKQNNYIIYIPKNLKELADEGEQQHNCVGSYYDKIIKGESIIFFIRNKNTPLESLITCEYSQEQLYQIKAKNNKTVNDDEILAFANKFCNILKTYK